MNNIQFLQRIKITTKYRYLLIAVIVISPVSKTAAYSPKMLVVVVVKPIVVEEAVVVVVVVVVVVASIETPVPESTVSPETQAVEAVSVAES